MNKLQTNPKKLNVRDILSVMKILKDAGAGAVLIGGAAEVMYTGKKTKDIDIIITNMKNLIKAEPKLNALGWELIYRSSSGLPTLIQNYKKRAEIQIIDVERTRFGGWGSMITFPSEYETKRVYGQLVLTPEYLMSTAAKEKQHNRIKHLIKTLNLPYNYYNIRKKFSREIYNLAWIDIMGFNKRFDSLMELDINTAREIVNNWHVEMSKADFSKVLRYYGV